MVDIVVGNLCSLAAMVTDSVSGTRKTRNQILGLQTLSQIFYGVGSFVLQGYSGTAQNLVAVLRNLATMKDLRQKWVGWLLVALGVILGALCNNRGLWGWLPIVANFGYSVAVVFFSKNERLLKVALVICSVMFSLFSGVIRNYVGVLTNLAVAAVTLLSLIREGRREKEAE